MGTAGPALADIWLGDEGTQMQALQRASKQCTRQHLLTKSTGWMHQDIIFGCICCCVAKYKCMLSVYH